MKKLAEYGKAGVLKFVELVGKYPATASILFLIVILAALFV